jgi:hypothetical protein
MLKNSWYYVKSKNVPPISLKVKLFYLDFIVNCVDDLSCLLDEVFAGHVLHRQLLDLGRRSLLSLAGGAAIVTVENTTRFDAKQLKILIHKNISITINGYWNNLQSTQYVT